MRRCFDAIQASLDELARMREQVTNGRRVSPARAMLDRLKSLGRPGQAAAAPAAAPAPAARRTAAGTAATAHRRRPRRRRPKRPSP